MKNKAENNVFCQDTSSGLFSEPIEEYHNQRAIGSSLLRTFMKSKAQFWNLWLNGDSKKTDALRIGSALHCLVLEPEKFNDGFAVGPEGVNRRTKVWAQFCEDNEDKETLTADQMVLVKGMANSIKASGLASGLLEGSHKEQSARVKLTNGMTIQCRPDAIKQNAVIDIKTCCSVNKFNYEVKSFGYHVQAAFYYFILRNIMPEEYENADFYFIAVDKTDVNEVLVTGIDNASLRLIVDDVIKPTLADIKRFFDEFRDINKQAIFQKEVNWLNVI